MYKESKAISIEKQNSKSDSQMYPNLDEELLTPENFKSLRPNTQKTTLTRHESLQTVVQQFSPKNGDSETNNGLIINRKKSKDSTRRSSFHEIPQNGGKTPTRDTERFAGAAFSNSPAPSSLPIPKFEGSEQSRNKDISNVQPTRLSFSPPKENNNNTKQPKSILKNGTRNQRNDSPTKKQYFQMDQNGPNDSSKSSMQDNMKTINYVNTSPQKPQLDQLSNQLKSLLNICPVQS